MENDAQSMRGHVCGERIPFAKVEGKVLDDVAGKTGDLIIKFVIEEGKQTLVASLKIEGMKSIPEEEIRSRVGSSPGQLLFRYQRVQR